MSKITKRTKYIQITGTIRNMQHPTGSDDHLRRYDSVVICNLDGEDVHFFGLNIPKRLDDHLPRGQVVTLRILRTRANQQRVGTVYAFQDGDKKYYYEDEAKHAIKEYVREHRIRSQFLFGNRLLAACTVILVPWSLALIFTGVVETVLGPIAGAYAPFAISILAAYYILYPVLRIKKYARFDLLEADLTQAGFSLSQPALHY